MKEKLKAFVFGMPKTKWLWHALMISCLVNMVGAAWIFRADQRVLVWVFVAIMWASFYWMSESFSNMMIKRYQKLTDDLLRDLKQAHEFLRKIKDEVDRAK